MKTLLLSLVLLSLPSPAAAHPRRAPQDDGDRELARRLDEYLTRLEGLGFSGVVGVDRDGKRVFEGGYGLADREADRPVTLDTVFTVGSITKQFTATAIMRLQMAGRLDVEDSIADYFSDVPPDKTGITLHHLLTHSSGLADGFGGDWDLQATDEWLLREALASELLWPPGTRYRYSNAGYSLLGMIVERVSGKPYEAFLREELFEPLGMHDTGYLLPRFAEDRLAVGYLDGERWGTVLQRPMLADGPCWNLRANGGIHSTVADMLTWSRALDGDDVLSPEAKARVFARHVDEGGGASFYGYGWAISETPRGTTLVSHNGGNGIFFADFLRYVDEGVTVFLATNVARDFSPVTRSIRRLVFDEPVEAPPATIARDAETLRPYAGSYRLDDESSFRVEVRGDRLVVRGAGEGAAALLGGSSETAATLRERTAALALGLSEGDLGPLADAMGGGRPRERVVAELGALREELEEELGALQGVGKVDARVAGESLRSFAELRFERGRRYLQLGWEDGHISMLGMEEDPPWSPGGELEVFPLSPTEFRTYSMRAGLGTRVGFELEDGGVTALTLDGDLGPVAAYRE